MQYHFKSNKANSIKSIDKKNKQSGQVVLEYILILVIVVGIAGALIKLLINRGSDESSQGMFIKGWNKIIKVIGNDLPDCPKQSTFDNPNCPP